MYYGLTSLGVVHTLISLVALFAGIFLLIRDRRITGGTTLGRVYVISTILVCLTGFGIFQHGGFGKPHVLGIVTLLTFVVIYFAHRGSFGKSSRYIETAAYTFTLFFHFVPTITEGATRLPYGSPLSLSPDDPKIQNVIAGFLLLFIVIVVLQIRTLKKQAPVNP